MVAEPEPDRDVVIGVLADPDLPAVIGERLAQGLPELLPERIDDVRLRWRVEVVRDPFEALLPDYERLVDKARERVRTTSWDMAVCVTDAPLRNGSGVVLAEVGAHDALAVLSLPALGGVDLSRRARRLVASLVEHLAPDVVGPDRHRPALYECSHLRHARTLRVSGSGDSDISSEIVVASPFGLPRLVAGMVRANRPWRLVWGLSAALGGALAGSAFGVFYSNIWSLADSLPLPRLLVVAAGALAVYGSWIVLGHGLWERADGSTRTDRAGLRLRNLGTALTVTFGILVFTAALFALTLAAALVVITPAYLASVLGHPVGPGDYLGVALMGTVMGTIAGAVGSGLENDATVREATYSHRERARARWE